MTLITLALLLTTEPESGYASRYNEGVFYHTIQTRIEKGYGYVPPDWTSYEGYFAGLDCAAVGQTIYARPGPGYRWERLLYADCSGHQSTTDMFIRNGIVGEIDYATYMRWKAAGYWSERGLTIEVIPLEAFYEFF